MSSVLAKLRQQVLRASGAPEHPPPSPRTSPTAIVPTSPARAERPRQVGAGPFSVFVTPGRPDGTWWSAEVSAYGEVLGGWQGPGITAPDEDIQQLLLADAARLASRFVKGALDRVLLQAAGQGRGGVVPQERDILERFYRAATTNANQPRTVTPSERAALRAAIRAIQAFGPPRGMEPLSDALWRAIDSVDERLTYDELVESGGSERAREAALQRSHEAAAWAIDYASEALNELQGPATRAHLNAPPSGPVSTSFDPAVLGAASSRGSAPRSSRRAPVSSRNRSTVPGPAPGSHRATDAETPIEYVIKEDTAEGVWTSEPHTARDVQRVRQTIIAGFLGRGRRAETADGRLIFGLDAKGKATEPPEVTWRAPQRHDAILEAPPNSAPARLTYEQERAEMRRQKERRPDEQLRDVGKSSRSMLAYELERMADAFPELRPGLLPLLRRTPGSKHEDKAESERDEPETSDLREAVKRAHRQAGQIRRKEEDERRRTREAAALRLVRAGADLKPGAPVSFEERDGYVWVNVVLHDGRTKTAMIGWDADGPFFFQGGKWRYMASERRADGTLVRDR
jgi:hypothetical protein